MKRNMKVYVWDNVLCDWTCGMVVIVARDDDEANRILIEHGLSEYISYDGNWSPQPTIVTDGPYINFVWGGG